MPKTKRDDPTELLRLALIGFDAQIAEMQKTRAQLAALIDQPPASPDVEVAAPRKRRKLSAEYKDRFSALRQKVRERADQIFMRGATPKIVKVCNEKGPEMNVIKRAPPSPDGQRLPVWRSSD